MGALTKFKELFQQFEGTKQKVRNQQVIKYADYKN